MKRTEIASNRLFHVFFQSVLAENKKIVPNYLIVSPKKKSKNNVTGIAILPIVGGKIALLKIYRPAVREEVWEVPRGFVEKGENPKKAAVRELREEIGGIVDEKSVRSMGYVMPEVGILDARIHIFVAEHCKLPKTVTLTESGHKQLRLFSFNQFFQMAQNSKIQDPGTLVAFYRYQCSNKRL